MADAESMETMLSHRDRVNENTLVPVRVPVRIVGPEETARKGERIEAGSVRIDSIGRSIRARYRSEEIVRVKRREESLPRVCVSPVAWPENNRNDRCVARIVAIPFADRQCLIGFGMPFSSGDPLPVASIYWARVIKLIFALTKNLS